MNLSVTVKCSAQIVGVGWGLDLSGNGTLSPLLKLSTYCLTAMFLLHLNFAIFLRTKFAEF